MQFGRREQAERPALLQSRGAGLECVYLAHVRSLLARPVEPAFRHGQVRQHAFVVEGAQLGEGIGVGFEGGIGEVAQDQTERVAIADLLERAGGKDLRGAAMLPWDIAQVDGRVGGLLRRDHAREQVDARIRDAHRAHAHLAAVADGRVQAGHGVEEGRLARARESREAESHGRGGAGPLAANGGRGIVSMRWLDMKTTYPGTPGNQS